MTFKLKIMKKTTKLTIIFSSLLVISLTFYAFKSLPDEGKKNVYMMITTFEGYKTSKMLSTDENGVSTEMDMESLGRWRVVSKQLISNNKSIVLKINTLAANGWTLVNTTSAESFNAGMVNRYLFVKQK